MGDAKHADHHGARRDRVPELLRERDEALAEKAKMHDERAAALVRGDTLRGVMSQALAHLRMEVGTPHKAIAEKLLAEAIESDEGKWR